MRKTLSRWFATLDHHLLLLLMLGLWALTPLTAPGYFYEAHDGRHSVFYLIQFDAAIRDGALWPRWAMHHIQGYGYPTFLIQAPLGFYLAELFVLLGAGYTLAVKLTWVTGFLLGGWGMYRLVVYWLRSERTGEGVRLAGLVAGLVYIFIPYHLVDIYVRAALNDSLLLAWFPWVFLAFDRLIGAGLSPGWQRRLALAALCLAGALLTHTFALISFAPLLVTFVLFRLGLAWHDAPAQRFGRIGLAGVAGLGALLLSASFLLPLLVEGRHLQQQVYVTDTYDFRNHFVYLGQFFSPAWGFGYSDDAQGAGDGMSFQVGAPALILGMAALFLLARRTKGRAYLVYLSSISIVLLLLMTPLATPVWNAIPALAVIQFPWRLLALAIFTLSGLAGLAIWQIGSPAISASQNGGPLLIGLLVIFASAGYIQTPLQPIEPWREDGRAIFQFEREHPDMLAYTEWVKQPLTESPMSAQYAADAYREDYSDNGLLARLAIVRGRGEVRSNYSRGSSMGGVVRIMEPATVRIHLLYFPGWQVRIDGVVVEHRVSDPHGLIEISVPVGEHRIDARMTSTPVRRLGTRIAWGTMVVVIGLLAWPGGWLRRLVR